MMWVVEIPHIYVHSAQYHTPVSLLDFIFLRREAVPYISPHPAHSQKPRILL